MMDEPKTLGRRFQKYHDASQPYGDAAPDSLKTLVRYADACERLARATDVMSGEDIPCGVDLREYDAALAAYREAVARG